MVASDYPLCFWRPAHRRELVPVGIAHVGHVEGRSIMQPHRRRAFGTSAMIERGLVKRIDREPRRGFERDHRAVARRRRLTVERLADPQREFLVAIVLIGPPSGPLEPFRDPALGAAPLTQRGHHRIVELYRTR